MANLYKGDVILKGNLEISSDKPLDSGSVVQSERDLTSISSNLYNGKIVVSVSDKAIYILLDKTKVSNISEGWMKVGANVDTGALQDLFRKISDQVDTIQSVIPKQASSTNQLADKNFVNSSIATNTATFKGTYVNEKNLYSIDADDNDYAFVVEKDSDGNTLYKRYKYNGSSWIFEYTLNNSSFTSEQWTSINSGITKEAVTKLTNLYDNNTLKSLFSEVSEDVATLKNTIERKADSDSVYTKDEVDLQLSQKANNITLSSTYISVDSMDNFLSALGNKMGGVWRKTWNARDNAYVFSFDEVMTGPEIP